MRDARTDRTNTVHELRWVVISSEEEMTWTVMEYGLAEDEAVEKSWVGRRQRNKVQPAHAIANPDDGTRELRSRVIDYAEDIARMIEQRCCSRT